MKIFDNPLLEKGLSATWQRNEALSQNIANVDTPGYKRVDVLNFQDYLTAAMNKDMISGTVPNTKQIPINNTASADDTQLKIGNDYNNTSTRLDGNNVDIDYEMSELAKNQILYNTFATLQNKNFSMLNTAIREGK